MVPAADNWAPADWTSVRSAVVRAVLEAELTRLGPTLTVVDVGGGSGGFAVPLATLGHRVTVVDPSPDALAALARRVAEQGLDPGAVRGVQGDIGDLGELAAVPPGAADLVLCHSVLEVVDDPAAAVAAVAGVLRPGGTASLLAANRCATVLARAIAGRFEEAAAAAEDPYGRWSSGDPVRRFDLTQLQDLAAAAGLHVEAVHGVRVVSDLVPGSLLDADPAASAALARLEVLLAELSPYRELAGQLHVLARRR